MKLSNTNLFQTKAYINGQWQDTAESYDVLNPADTSLLTKVSSCGAKEANAAINAAQQALADWQGYTANERGQILRRWAELMLENTNDLARIMVYEQGKPFAEAKGEVAYAASFLTWYAEEGRRVNGDIIPPFAPISA